MLNESSMIAFVLLLLAMLFTPDLAFAAKAAGVIGQDMTITIPPVAILDTGNPDYDIVFNFFATLEIFFGMVAFFIRTILRIARI